MSDRQTGIQIAIAAVASAGLVAAWTLLPHPALGIALAVLPLAAVIGLGSPFLLCLGFVIFSFFRIHEAFPVLNPLRLPQLLALGTLAALGWHIWIGRTLRVAWSRDLNWFAGFFVLVTLGVLVASNRGMAMAYFTSTYIKIAIMVLAITWLTRRPEDFSLAARLFVVAGIAVAFVALRNKAAGIGLVEGTRVTIGRDIGSALGDPNDLALVLLFPAGFAAALATTSRIGLLNRFLGAAGFIAVFLAVLATQSRGGLLGIAAVGGVFARKYIRSNIALGAIGILGLAVLFAAAGISDRASGGAHEAGIDESAMGRLYAWGAALKMALARPLTGVGLDNFYVNYFFYSDHWDGKNHAVHSTWFGVLAETGFPGLVVFFIMVVKCGLSALRSCRLLDAADAPPAARAMAWALLAGLAGFAISGTFLTQGFTWPLYIQLALTAAIGRYAEEPCETARAGPAPSVI